MKYFIFADLKDLLDKALTEWRPTQSIFEATTLKSINEDLLDDFDVQEGDEEVDFKLLFPICVLLYIRDYLLTM